MERYHMIWRALNRFKHHGGGIFGPSLNVPQKMPKYYEDKEEVDKQPKVACSGLRDDLKECLLKSDCVRVHGRTPKECLMLKDDPNIPQECYSLRRAFYECKRSLLDMRTRFRGRKGY